MFPARFAAGRTVPVAVCAVSAVALAALTVACGSPATPAGELAAAGVGAAPAGMAKLTGPAATALVNKAVADTRAAGSVRITGQAAANVPGAGTAQGGPAQMVRFDMTLVKNAGCEGTLEVSKTETLRVVKTAGYVWVLPDSSFYAVLNLSPAVQAAIAGKYLKFSAGSSQVSDLAGICTTTGVLGSVPKTTRRDYTATPVSYHGAPAYKVTEQGQQGVAYLSRTADPLLLEVTQPHASAATITFTGYNATKSITAPTNAESLNGSQIGA